MRKISKSTLLDEWPMQFIPIGVEAEHLCVGVLSLEVETMVRVVYSK